jgi:metal-responsive CopG/Arc/MetJ family transcriptional regulator
MGYINSEDYMNLSIYIDTKLYKELDKIVDESKQPKNKIIREAIKQYIDSMKKNKWSQDILNYKGDVDINFTSYRDDLVSNSKGFLE